MILEGVGVPEECWMCEYPTPMLKRKTIEEVFALGQIHIRVVGKSSVTWYSKAASD